MISLWVATVYLVKNGKSKRASLITAIGAAFMSAVSSTYILMAEEGFHLSVSFAYPCTLVFSLCLFGVYHVKVFRKE